MADQMIHHHIGKSPNRQSQGFTLVEMVVVIAIVILLTGLVVPAATQIWRDRKIADAQNVITGMLMTARARAIQSGGAETGLFFFVDDQGVQRVAPITQNPNDPAESEANKLIRGWESDGRWSNVFTVLRGRTFTLPAPMRVVPLYAICDPQNDTTELCMPKDNDDDKPYKFSDDELVNPTLGRLPIGAGSGQNANTAQAHRNNFTLVFSPNGEMIIGRDVLIRDIDDEKEAEGVSDDAKGVVTGLTVKGATAEQQSPVVSHFYDNEPNSPKIPLQATGPTLFPTWLVVDSTDTAFNFPSIDGLLVYDDSLFNEAGSPVEKRKYLKDFGMPFYINRITGAVVRGPVGETVATTP